MPALSKTHAPAGPDVPAASPAPTPPEAQQRTPWIDETEVTVTAIRAQGAGGQNVNKVSSAIHLRFDIAASSLPDDVKARMLALHDKRITQDGVLIIKAQQYRTQDQNRLDAFARLHALIESVAEAPKVRRPTRPTRASRVRRLEGKRQQSATKAARRKVNSAVE